jgi:hypothetical protein
VSDEADYDDLDGPRSPSPWEALLTGRAKLIGAGVLLTLLSLGLCSVTVAPGPGVEFWHPFITYGSGALAIVAFIAAGIAKPRP